MFGGLYIVERLVTFGLVVMLQLLSARLTLVEAILGTFGIVYFVPGPGSL